MSSGGGAAINPHAGGPVFAAGVPLAQAKAVVILIHGRGAGARDILGLAGALGVAGVTYLAPEAAGRVWYPQRFMVPRADNQPYLDGAHAIVAGLIRSAGEAGIPPERVVLAGFSQGACLSLDHAALNPRRYGAIIGFSGGLIGDRIDPKAYSGSLAATPVFLGCSDVDQHIPVERVHQSAAILKQLGGAVTERIYPGMGHTINDEEVGIARAMVEGVVAG